MKNELVTFGETMILFEAESEGGFRYTSRFIKRMGGAESNVAIAVTKLGHDATWMSKVSDDELGEFVVRELQAEGVNTAYVKKTTTAPTAIYIKERKRADQTNVYYFRHGSAASELTASDLDFSVIEQAKILHVTGITLLLSDSCYEAAMEAVLFAKEKGVFVSFDPNLRFALIKRVGEDTSRERILTIAKLADLVLPGLDEASWLLGEKEEQELVQEFITLGAGSVVLKNNDHEMLYATKEESGKLSGFHVENVADPVGAGDGFAAGVLVSLLENKPLKDAVRFGSAVGALVVQTKGDFEGMPERKEVDALINQDNKVNGGVLR
ncbi:hypothetical protein BALCAV_0210255 [Alkalihalobacillus alcalophilus ATCC 27647 = CGMCC 1.3604]|nr:sugar kinase [Alkalihalobacillus alcalophilus]KGA97452.1 hypothetical protein BALCAV_0210255 [Alkalihalobacillus alcalophilus ATCC 27647 = CGMCC 1.3604]MED1562228.1 sugar kinase [Alkalihalobacillus alcalophilus]